MSWSITEKLTEAFLDTEAINEDEVIITSQPQNNIEAMENVPDNIFTVKISQYAELLDLIKAEQYSKQKQYAKSHNLILEAVIDEINEISVEIFGDILIEEIDDGYRIIDDYKDILT